MKQDNNDGGGARVKLQLHSWPLSDCSGRLRIALNWKGLAYETINVDLRSGEHRAVGFKSSVNAAGTVPTLTVTSSASQGVNVTVITQSLAAMEYIEEKFSGSCSSSSSHAHTAALLPDNVEDRARVRSLMNIFATDVHPLLTHRVADAIAPMFPSEQDNVDGNKTGSGQAAAAAAKVQVNAEAKPRDNREWNIMWISRGLDAYETALQSTAGRYSFGDTVTLADVVFVPTTWTATRSGMDLSNWPRTKQVHDNLMQLHAFQDAKQELPL